MAISAGAFSLWVFFFTLLTALGIQIATNFANDLFDFLKGADTSERKGPVRVTASGLISVAQMKLATFSLMMVTAACGSVLIFRGGMVIAYLIALALLLALGYTAGPFPLAYLGLAEFFILIFFGPVATGSTYYLQTLQLSPKAFLAGLAPGLISCSLLIVNNLRDSAEDKQSNKKTLVVRFGKIFGKWEYALCLYIALLIPLLLAPKHLLVLLCLSCSLPVVLLTREVFRNEDPYAYNPLLGKTGQLLTLFTFIFCFGYVL